jgi:hypothetical protein
MTETKRHKKFIIFQHGCEDTIPVKSNLFDFFSTSNALSNSFLQLAHLVGEANKSKNNK